MPRPKGFGLRQNDSLALLYALAGFVLLSCGDAVVKTMAGEFAPTGVAALRYLIGGAGLALLLLWREGPAAFAMPHPRIQLLRGVAIAVSALGFFSALFVMPLAAATAITFTSPMLTVLLAALFLGEPARRETWIASLAAFAGMLIVLRPNIAAAGWAVLLPVVAALGMSVLMICNRFVAGKASPLAMQFFLSVGAAPVLAVAALLGHFSGFEPLALVVPEWSVVARCALVALSASVAHWFIFNATARAGAATIAPMTYVQLLVASVLGWAVFGNHPDGLTLLGAAIIIGSGLYLWRAGRVRDLPQPE